MTLSASLCFLRLILVVTMNRLRFHIWVFLIIVSYRRRTKLWYLCHRFLNPVVFPHHHQFQPRSRILIFLKLRKHFRTHPWLILLCNFRVDRSKCKMLLIPSVLLLLNHFSHLYWNLLHFVIHKNLNPQQPVPKLNSITHVLDRNLVNILIKTRHILKKHLQLLRKVFLTVSMTLKYHFLVMINLKRHP